MTQRLPDVLTPLDVAVRLLCEGLNPVEPVDVPLAEALGRVAAAMAPQQVALPPFSIAVTDGWALRARDIVGASSYSPLPLSVAPAWVEAGDPLPDGCDCVLDADLVDRAGPLFEVLAEAAPGHGIRRAGEDIAAGQSIIGVGRPVSVIDLLGARTAKLERLLARIPLVCIIDIPAHDGSTSSSEFIAAFAKAAGARVLVSRAGGRNADSIAGSIAAGMNDEPCDLLVTVGGSGLGRGDEALQALAAPGGKLAHGLTLQPGRTAAVGKLGLTPLVAAPGAPDQALAVCLALVRPALDRLTGRVPRQQIQRPLARKISSAIGLTEIVLLQFAEGNWMPLAAGQFSLEAMARADAWLAVPGDSEGYAAGTDAGGFLLRDMM